jgi:hypothetical protein
MKFTAVDALALTLILNAGPLAAHEWYSGLKNPLGLSCCNDRDCHPVEHRYSPGNGHEVEVQGEWVPVNPRIILPQSSPDGLVHACYLPVVSTLPFGFKTDLTLRCVILGGMS